MSVLPQVLPAQKQGAARLKIIVQGTVQGVGFRPFIFRLAQELKLTGWVKNSLSGAVIEAEGAKENLEHFIIRIKKEKPPQSFIQSLEFSFLDAIGHSSFEIKASDDTGKKTALILPDFATCPDCRDEIFDALSRRYLYPFTNCTHCGPRFTIVETLPYDRKNTSMKGFTMCPDCQREYEDPQNRRFHAQPNACPACGPQLELWNKDGKVLSRKHEAVLAAAQAIRDGKIVALKGLGGFHLIVDARNETAILRLRKLKFRQEKPFALMFPSIKDIEKVCEVSGLERNSLESGEAPIVILRRKKGTPGLSSIAPSVAPKNPCLAVMLPYTPLHHILLKLLSFPIVATSGNLSDEPISTDEHEALGRLGGIADLFLIHDRPIVRHADDSIVKMIAGRPMIFRRARGFAPLPIETNDVLPPAVSVGGHLKNTIAVTAGNNIFISQHIGDLETHQSTQAFEQAIKDFRGLYEVSPSYVACDMHPEYLSTKYAKNLKIPVKSIQHHHAHIVSCMAENEIDGQVLGVAWDGTGFGTDGCIWGGEFLFSSLSDFKRTAYLRYFPLPGGEKAVREPRRSALGILYTMFGEKAFEQKSVAPTRAFKPQELYVISKMLKQSIHSPLTSSVGRLFDAVSSLLDLHHITNFEGQAAMSLEHLTEDVQTKEFYPFHVSSTDPMIIDWEPMILDILKDIKDEISPEIISAKFHNALSEMIVAIARISNEEKVVLSGGCFQNRYLTQCAVARLREEGFKPYWHQRVPCNDGGISLGQMVAASCQINKGV
ncbi:MAG: carbamoyltransferase HypF [Candidatus Omnitrophota bacterium]